MSVLTQINYFEFCVDKVAKASCEELDKFNHIGGTIYYVYYVVLEGPIFILDSI